MKTFTGVLNYGIEHDGVTHYEFVLGLPTVADNIAALEEVGSDSNLRLSVAMLAKSIISLGTIPAENINYELVSQLVDDDYDLLTQAQSDLKKRLKALKPALPDTALPV